MRALYGLLPLCICLHYVAMWLDSRPSLWQDPWLLYPPVLILIGSRLLYLRLIASDPGRPDVADEEHDGPTCDLCMRLRFPRTKHCPFCDECVLDFDHHCDILDMCIGGKNLRLFRTFLWTHAVAITFGCVQHARIVYARPHASHALFFVLAAIEFAFGFATLAFCAFHFTLHVFDVRTYELIVACRRFFFKPAKGPKAAEKCD